MLDRRTFLSAAISCLVMPWRSLFGHHERICDIGRLVVKRPRETETDEFFWDVTCRIYNAGTKPPPWKRLYARTKEPRLALDSGNFTLDVAGCSGFLAFGSRSLLA